MAEISPSQIKADIASSPRFVPKNGKRTVLIFLISFSTIKKCNPKCSNIDWLQAYFEEMICGKLCSGAYEGSILVSCADAPGMPYMSDEVQEIGINTLPDYRGKGYATIACQSSINEMLKNGELGLKLGMNDYSDLNPLTKEVVMSMNYVEKDESEFNSEIEIPFFTHDEAVAKKKVMKNKLN